MLDTNEVLEWRGRTAVDAEGDEVGTLEEIYLDQETDRPEWALIDGTTFVPLTDASAHGDDIQLAFPGEQIKGAPKLGGDELSQQDEAALYRHYGVDYGEDRSNSGLPEGHASGERTEVTEDRADTVGRDVSGPETDSAMTRSEEELRVGTTQHESGRVRLRKHIVSEQVQETVPVTREEIRVEREPITEANVGDARSGGELTEEEHEVTLMAEEAIVDKRVVAKERVRLDKDEVTEDVEVSEEVRREEIEIDGASGTDEGTDRR